MNLGSWWARGRRLRRAREQRCVRRSGLAPSARGCRSKAIARRAPPCPKILLAGRFAVDSIWTCDRRAGRGDHRSAWRSGRRQYGWTAANGARRSICEGFHGPERQGSALVPVDLRAARACTCPSSGRGEWAVEADSCSCDRPKTVTVAVRGVGSGDGERPQIRLWLVLSRQVRSTMPLVNSAGRVCPRNRVRLLTGATSNPTRTATTSRRGLRLEGLCSPAPPRVSRGHRHVFDEASFSTTRTSISRGEGAREDGATSTPRARGSIMSTERPRVASLARRVLEGAKPSRRPHEERSRRAALRRVRRRPPRAGASRDSRRDQPGAPRRAARPGLRRAERLCGSRCASLRDFRATLAARQDIRQRRRSTDDELLAWVAPRTASEEAGRR